MKRKIFITLFLLIILMASTSFASYSTVTMNVVEEPVCTIDIGNNSKLEKKLFSKDLNNKEVTIQLQVSNNEIPEKLSGELLLVLDNSESMSSQNADGKTRRDLVFNSANTLISNLLKDNEKLKIGIVTFSSNSDVSKEGTLEDATLTSSLTNDYTTLTNAISQIKVTGPRTNLDAGLKLASKQFSTEKDNKYMIILTDGIPNIAVDYDKKYFSDDVISKTSEELKTLDQNGIQLITMLTGINNENGTPGTTEKTYAEIIKEIFGTATNPTAGKFYYIDDSKIEETICNDIYNSLLPKGKSYKDITIIDYFPDEIVKNFNFAYVSQANKGNISAQIDTQTNSITWTIPELASGETATVQYKLKLKENFDSTIVNKVLNTNKKIDISYKDIDEKTQTKTSDVSPKLKLTEPPATLPKAGIITIISASVLVGGFALFSLIKFIKLNNNF